MCLASGQLNSDLLRNEGSAGRLGDVDQGRWQSATRQPSWPTQERGAGVGLGAQANRKNESEISTGNPARRSERQWRVYTGSR